TYVTDTAAAFIALGEAPAEAVLGGVFNAGTGSEVSIGELARLLCEVTGRNPHIVEDQDRLRPSTSEVMRLVSDSSRLRRATGWRPECDLRDGLKATATWFSEPHNLARYKWDQYNL